MAIGRPVLYLIADRTFAGSDQGWLQNIKRIVSSIDTSANPETTILFQLRANDVGKEERTTLVAKGLEATRPAGVPVLLNGSEKEARALGYAGVHWPEALIPMASQHKQTRALNDNFLRIAAVHNTSAPKAGPWRRSQRPQGTRRRLQHSRNRHRWHRCRQRSRVLRRWGNRRCVCQRRV